MKHATLEQAGKIISIFKDTPSKQVQALLESGLLADLRDGNIAKVDRNEFRKLLGLESLQIAQNANIIVKCPRSLSELIKARHFDGVNPDITDKRFPAPDRLWNNYKEFHFGEEILSEEVVKRMQAEGYEPANSRELLLWDEWNNESTVVALGSVAKVDGTRIALYLCRGVFKRRSLCLGWWDGGWPAGCRFLAVRKRA
ncbi:MAG: hypothetical protein AAB630_03630 [Patescibacteria group bacterium]